MELWRNYERSFVRLLARGAGKVAARAATVDGARKPLSWALDEFFAGMTTELERQGVGRRVASGMFGVSRRTYIRRLQAAEVGTQAQGDSLWWMVLQAIRAESMAREELLARFSSRSPELIGAIVFDMLETNLLEEQDDVYVATTVAEGWSDERLENFIHMLVVEDQPTVEELAHTLGVEADRVAEALASVETSFTVRDAEYEALWRLLGLFVEHAYTIAHRELDNEQTDGFVYRIGLTETGKRHLPELTRLVVDGRDRIRANVNEFLAEHGTRDEGSSVFFTTVLSYLVHDRGWVDE